MFERLKSIFSDFCASESGATAIEYGVIAAGVAGLVTAAVYNLGGTIQTTFYTKLTAVMK